MNGSDRKGSAACVLAAMIVLGGCATHDRSRWVEGCRSLPQPDVLTDVRLLSLRAEHNTHECRVEIVAPSSSVLASQKKAIAAWTSGFCDAVVTELPVDDHDSRGMRALLSIPTPDGASCGYKGDVLAPGSGVEVEQASRMRYVPEYPHEAVVDGAEGVARITALVHPGGEVLGVVVSASSGHAALDQSAVDAVGRWHFKPRPEREGVVLVTVPVRFQIQ